jgi:hypothetical protein
MHVTVSIARNNLGTQAESLGIHVTDDTTVQSVILPFLRRTLSLNLEYLFINSKNRTLPKSYKIRTRTRTCAAIILPAHIKSPIFTP